MKCHHRKGQLGEYMFRKPSWREVNLKTLTLLFFFSLCFGVYVAVKDLPLPDEPHAIGVKDVVVPRLPDIPYEEIMALYKRSVRMKVPGLKPWGGDEGLAMFYSWKDLYRSIRSDIDFRFRKNETTATAASRSLITIQLFDTQYGYLTTSFATYFPEVFIYSIIFDGSVASRSNARRVADTPKQVAETITRILESSSNTSVETSNLFLCEMNSTLPDVYINETSHHIAVNYQISLFPYAFLKAATSVESFEDLMMDFFAGAATASFVAFPVLPTAGTGPSSRHTIEARAYQRWYGDCATPEDVIKRIASRKNLTARVLVLGSASWNGLKRQVLRVEAEEGAVHPEWTFGCAARNEHLRCAPRSSYFNCPFTLPTSTTSSAPS